MSGTQTYTVAVDQPSPEGKNFQFATFFPASLKVRPGDSIVFDNLSTQAPHTVSFGIVGDRSNQPPPSLPSGAGNPARLLPCFSPNPPTASLTECPTKEETPSPYRGAGYWNSGFLVPASAPSGPKKITMKLDPSVAPGTYLYVCILHKPMVATITVVSSDDERKTPEDVGAEGRKQFDDAKRAAEAIRAPSAGAEGGSFNAIAGFGEGDIAVNKFVPATIEVKAGTKVSWVMKSAFEPHTITFGSKWKSGDDDPASFAPGGAKSGARYSGGLANSGLIPPGLPQPAFSLTFAKPGQYNYVCVLHPFMEGIVNVT